MKQIYYKFEHSDLSSRSSARHLRESLLSKWSEGDIIRLELSSVKLMSDSYADEFFGVLSRIFGLELFLATVRIVNVDLDVEIAIARSVRLRNEEELNAGEVCAMS